MSKISLLPESLRPEPQTMRTRLKDFYQRTASLNGDGGQAQMEQKSAAVSATPTGAQDEYDLEQIPFPPRLSDIRAEVAEKIRLANYTPEERAHMAEIFTPEEQKILLKPQLTLREKLGRLSVKQKAWAMCGLLLMFAGGGYASTQIMPASSQAQQQAIGFSNSPEAAVSAFNAEAESGAATNSAGGFTEQNSGERSTQSKEIFVHIIGEVAKPGVYKLQPASRVADAIEKAGGATENAVLEKINLARQLQDGEQILVPNAEQAATAAALQNEPLAGSEQVNGAAANATVHQDSQAAGAGRININTAAKAELETLPKIGAVTAERIIAWREKNGGFKSVEQLLEVAGIGEKTMTGLRERVTV